MTRQRLLRELSLAVSLAHAALTGALRDAERLAEQCEAGDDPLPVDHLRLRLMQVIGNLRCAARVTAASLEPVREEVTEATADETETPEQRQG